MSNPEQDLFNLGMSEKAQPLFYAVQKHVEDNVLPITEEFFPSTKVKPIFGNGILAS